ncbi:MAG: outer membrane beta-barrel protein [Burkholderiales bacterium]|nr:outer membrane beta-barrel protein [Burkholderiales bacterium]
MKKIRFAACALLVLASASVFAQENTIRAGLVNLSIHSKSPDFTSNGPAFLTPPAGLEVGDANTLLFSYARKITNHVDIELALGLPPKHNVYGRGKLAAYGVLAQVKQRAPTIFANYNFGEASDKFRPYVGLGLNYTQFFDAQSTPMNDLGSGGPTKIDLKESYGLAGQVGLNYKLADRWFIGASLATAKVKTDMTATTGSIQRKTTIDFRPVVFALGVGYNF